MSDTLETLPAELQFLSKVQAAVNASDNSMDGEILAERRRYDLKAFEEQELHNSEFVDPNRRKLKEQAIETKYHAEQVKAAQELAAVMDAAHNTLDTAEQSYKELVSEAAQVGTRAASDPHLALQARLVDAVEAQNAKAELSGLTAQEVGALYRKLDDGVLAHRAMIRTIETASKSGFRPLQLASSKSEAGDLVALQQAIRERQNARVPTWVAQGRTKLKQLYPVGRRERVRMLTRNLRAI